ncbi:MULTISPECIES: hypothetical protein [unclassified Bacillus (in: firmicutes)]|uniref:hypothetical protein n=1 Tax=unclassified Bacillus (in: firmicutes) TaxID=185979 RepID=UPI001BE8AB2E|nr:MULTISPECIES: hypothetical protein [unclassified Bacillus (in: firmicutes)]MBT2614437.1 hypothetical protein [Bacillus sp. ISL-78]MBT2628508.1 hypothetical protein [Bacillus sp. ISL-101]
MESVPNVQEILLDKEIDEQEFFGIINSIYKQDCYIYAIIPGWEPRKIWTITKYLN